MKKVLIFSLFLILFMGMISGLSINSTKTEFQPRETAVVSFKGNFFEPVNKDQVEVRRNNVIVPVDYIIQKFDNEYVVVFVTPVEINNYTLWIYDLSYVDKGVQVTRDEGFNFTVNGSMSDYYVKPQTLNPKEEFFATVYSNLDDNLNIEVNFPSVFNKELIPGENKIYFPVNTTFGTKKVNITIGKYEIPFLIIGSLTENNVVENEYGLRVYPSDINKVVSRNSDLTYFINMTNFGESNLEGIRIKYDSDNLYFSPDNNFSLNGGETKEFTLRLRSLRDYVGVIEFLYLNATISVNVEFEVKEGQVNNQTNDSVVDSSQYFCEELAGVVCQGTEVCEGEIKTSLNGECCKGVCKEPASSLSIGILGWVIIVIILGVIGFLIWKYKKAPLQGESSAGSMLRQSVKDKRIP